VHAHRVMVESVVTTCVQNYTGSRLKSGCWRTWPQADMRSVCVIHTAVDKISTNIEHHVGLLAIAQPLVQLHVILWYVSTVDRCLLQC